MRFVIVSILTLCATTGCAHAAPGVVQSAPSVVQNAPGAAPSAPSIAPSASTSEPTVTLTQSELAALMQGSFAEGQASPSITAARPVMDKVRKAFAAPDQNKR